MPLVVYGSKDGYCCQTFPILEASSPLRLGNSKKDLVSGKMALLDRG
jgi:hypothetical protein